MKKRRVFVALSISEELQYKIKEWRDGYQGLSVRWIKKENLHITIIPPWYTDKVDKVINKLESVFLGRKSFWTLQFGGQASQNDVGLKPFTITFKKVTFGPNLKKPRLIWARGETPPEAIVLKSKLEKVFKKKSEKRPILTHLTIARFKEKDFTKFSVKSLSEKILWREKFNSFFLMESHLKRSGAEYEKLAEILL